MKVEVDVTPNDDGSFSFMFWGKLVVVRKEEEPELWQNLSRSIDEQKERTKAQKVQDLYNLLAGEVRDAMPFQLWFNARIMAGETIDTLLASLEKEVQMTKFPCSCSQNGDDPDCLRHGGL
jgi:hypothetical protein